MRTKTLVLSAVLCAAGALSSMAQNVYSLNVVGYVNLSLTNGFQMIANQMDFDGTGTNNNVTTVFGTNLPTSSRIYSYNATSASFASTATYNAGTGKWIGDTNSANALLQPGGGVFLSIPAASVTPITVTTVGTVLQGTLATPVVAGFNIISSKAPLSGGIGSALGLTNGAATGDYVFQFSPVTQGYGAKHTFNAGAGTWVGGEPTIAVGEAFWYNAKVAGSRTVTFTVQ
jgi:hypothetical protein